MTDADLIRFLDAQDQIYHQVLGELAKGRKETHVVHFSAARGSWAKRYGPALRYTRFRSG